MPTGCHVSSWRRAHDGRRPGTSLTDLGASLWLWDDPEIGLRRCPAVRVDRLRLVVCDRARDDHVLAWLPVYRRCDPVLGGELQRVDDRSTSSKFRPVVIG